MSAADRASPSRSRSSTTAWETAARSRRRSSTSARGRWSRATSAAARRRRPGRARAWARSRARWTTCASWASTSCCASASPRRPRCSASAWGWSCFDRSTEQGGAEGLGVVAGEVRELQSGSLKLPHIGWNEVRFATAARRCSTSCRASAPSTTCTPSRPCRRATEDVLGIAEYGAPFVSAVQKGSFYGVQFHPEKSSAAGLRMLANFARICAGAPRRPPRCEALPGDRHPRRQRRAPGQGRLRREEGLRRGPAVGGARLDRRRRHPPARRRPGRCAGGAPVNLEHLRRIAGELGVPVQYGGGLRSAQAVDERCARARPG